MEAPETPTPPAPAPRLPLQSPAPPPVGEMARFEPPPPEMSVEDRAALVAALEGFHAACSRAVEVHGLAAGAYTCPLHSST